jgi:hypothetical protein
MSKTSIDKKIMYFDLNKKRFPGFTLGCSRQKRLLKMKINDIYHLFYTTTKIKQNNQTVVFFLNGPC